MALSSSLKLFATGLHLLARRRYTSNQVAHRSNANREIAVADRAGPRHGTVTLTTKLNSSSPAISACTMVSVNGLSSTRSA